MLKYSHISRPRSCRVGDVNHQPACKPVGSGRVSVWDSGMSPVSASQQRKGTCFERTLASEALEMRMGSTNTHTSTKLQNLQKLTKRWRSRSRYPSISMSLSSLIPLSTFCHQSGREGEKERMREKEREMTRLLAGLQAVWTDTGGCGEPSRP